ncbi:MAG: MBL fold metallo-hydrolase [Candidatus Levybacteria bacterium]|nr:MBL fold metallo-hydrolase [Candidatus Levybacteria bacterium]
MEVSDITWLGHASFFFTDQTSGNRIYYIDPFEIKNISLAKADLIFITHAHYDHCSLQDIQKIIKNDTLVIAPSDCLTTLGIEEEKQFPVTPSSSFTVRDFSFQTIPAYNINPSRLSFHPKDNNWVGYIFSLNGKKVYHAGDTDFTPEMKGLNTLHLDVAMLPMGGTYTMDVTEAIEAANAISAKITIPMHYKRLLGEGYKQTEEQLKQSVTNSKVVILPELR